jgi:hypothetical protein
LAFSGQSFQLDTGPLMANHDSLERIELLKPAVRVSGHALFHTTIVEPTMPPCSRSWAQFWTL